MKRRFYSAVAFVAACMPVVVNAQGALPTSQPAVLTIYREEVKYGHGAEHEALEAGWPAAFAKARYPHSYLAMTSITGNAEAWFMQPFANYKAMDEAQKLEGANPVLSAELARLSKADAEHVSNARGLHLIGRPDLSAGAFPSIAKARFYQVTFFRVRPGHEQEFERLGGVFSAAYKKAAPDASYRVYQVSAGMPGPTYVLFSSVQTLADLDKGMATDAAVMGAMSPDDLSALQKFAATGLVNSETQRFAVNGRMSYVDDATASQDPAFWRPAPKASK